MNLLILKRMSSALDNLYMHLQLYILCVYLHLNMRFVIKMRKNNSQLYSKFFKHDYKHKFTKINH